MAMHIGFSYRYYYRPAYGYRTGLIAHARSGLPLFGLV